jgi:Flp pilus assembly pilin Flp
MGRLLLRLWHGEEGQDLSEYGLLMVLITLVGITGIRVIGQVVCNVLSNTAGDLTSS